MPDISAILKSTRVSLEQTATSEFGAAVDDFTRGFLGGKSGETAPSNKIARRDPSTWVASSYAAALAGGTNYRPKLKFLFKVEFIFTPEAVAAYPQLKSNDFTFMIKAVDRPKVDFEYEDDVNRYNFRTKVLKKIRHRELTVTFMDDTGNRVFDFFRTLMFLHSPITQRVLTRESIGRGREAPTPLSITEGNGMAFSSVGALGQAPQNDIAHRGVINSFVGGSIACIRVKQMYVDPAGRNGGDHMKIVAPEEVTYDFLNPRIVSFDLDDLTHDSSDPSLLTMQFDYDWMEMCKVGPMYEANTPVYNITVPGITSAPSDILSGISQSNEGAPKSVGISPAGAGNPFLKILTNQASRAAQKVTSDLVNKAVKSVAGNGRLATGLGGVLSGALGSTANGLLGAATASIATGAKSAYNTITRPIANDSATRNSDNATIVTSADGKNF